MGLYNVYLGTPLKFPSPLEFSTIRSTLEAWFQKVVEKAGGFTGARVQYADNQPAIQPHELLIYLVWSQGDSIVKAMLPKQKLGDDGTTFMAGGQTGSEVYVTNVRSEPRAIAALAFHEAMHNKLNLGNDLHLKPKVSLGAREVSASSALTDGDIALMAPKLNDARPQWTNGFVIAHDPLRL